MLNKTRGIDIAVGSYFDRIGIVAMRCDTRAALYLLVVSSIKYAGDSDNKKADEEIDRYVCIAYEIIIIIVVG